MATGVLSYSHLSVTCCCACAFQYTRLLHLQSGYQTVAFACCGSYFEPLHYRCPWIGMRVQVHEPIVEVQGCVDPKIQRKCEGVRSCCTNFLFRDREVEQVSLVIPMAVSACPSLSVLQASCKEWNGTLAIGRAVVTSNKRNYFNPSVRQNWH